MLEEFLEKIKNIFKRSESGVKAPPPTDLSDDEATRKKKLKTKIIQTFVALVISYGALDVLVLSDQSPKKVMPIKLPKKVAEAKTVGDIPPAPSPSPTTEIEQPGEQPSIDQIDVEQLPPVVTNEETVADVSAPVMSTDSPTVQEVIDVEKSVEGIGEASAEPDMTSHIKEDVAVSSALDDIVSKVDQAAQSGTSDSAQLEPISYDNLGRGLVYDCKEKHWACVDRKNYLVCRKHQETLKARSEAPDCVPVAVYADDRGCRIMQMHSINTAASTDFCK